MCITVRIVPADFAEAAEVDHVRESRQARGARKQHRGHAAVRGTIRNSPAVMIRMMAVGGARGQPASRHAMRPPGANGCLGAQATADFRAGERRDGEQRCKRSQPRKLDGPESIAAAISSRNEMAPV